MRRLRATGLLAAGLIVVSATGSAADKRIAYSKQHGIEIFAEDAGGGWCQETLSLRFEGKQASAINDASLQELVTKLGAVLPRECASAANFAVRGVVGDQTHYRGSASKADNWHLTADAAAPVAPAASITQGEEKTAPVATTTAEAAAASTAAAAPPAVPDVTPPASVTPEHSAPEVAQTKEPATPAPVPAAEVATPAAAPVASAPVPAPVDFPSAPFAVGTWSPPASGYSIAVADGLDEYVIKTADGSCAMRLSHLQDKSVLQFLVLKAEGFDCYQGFLHGDGKAQIDRSDGRRHTRLSQRFHQGYPIEGDLHKAPLIGRFRDARRYQWFSYYIESDAGTRSHFVGYAQDNRGTVRVCGYPRIGMITENDELFVNAEYITQAVQRAADHMNRYCPKASQFEFFAASEPVLATQQAQKDALMYQLSVRRNYRSKDWTIDLAQARNYVMERRMAKAREEEQRARAEAAAREQAKRRMGQEYQWLKNAKFMDRVAFMHNVKGFDPLPTVATASVINNESYPVSALVHVDDIDDGMAEVDWPQSAKLVALPDTLDGDGWYLVTGTLRADAKERKDGFLVPTITLERATRCLEDECGEANDVVKLLRARYDVPDWSPETP